MGDGTVADMLWARPSATVLGHRRAAGDRLLLGGAGVGGRARQPAGAARDRRPGGAGRARRAPAARVPWGLHCTIERVAVGDPFVGSLDGPGLRGAQGGDGGGLRARDDHRGPGRLDPALQRARRDLPRRRDHADGRRGAEVPDPRAQRERGPVRDRAHRARRGAVPRALRGGRRDDRRRVHRRRLRARMERGAAGRPPTPGWPACSSRPARTSCTSPATRRRRSPSGSRCSCSAGPRAGDGRADAGAPRRRGGARRAARSRCATGPTATTRTRRPPPLLDPHGRYGITDTAWAMHLLGLQERAARARYASLTEALPMLRAVKDADELERLAAAGRGRGRDVRGDPQGPLRRPQGDRGRRRPGRPAARARPLPGRLHRRRLRARTAPTRTTRRATG